MFRQVAWPLFVLTLSSGTGFTQESVPEQPPTPKQAEVRFGDGSRVRMTILQKEIDVQTKYGKLSIPISDIRRIEFGLHLPDGVAPKIDEAIKQMGSNLHQKREAAVSNLLEIGPLAYPALKRALRSTDLEVAKRSHTVLKQITDKTPPEHLRTKEDDFIQTTSFPVVGRIVSPIIRAHSHHFGDLELKLPDLRSIQLRGTANEAQVQVKASRFEQNPESWLDSGIETDSNLRVMIQCDGQVDLWPQGPGQYITGPEGYKTNGRNSTHPAGALLGRIGEKGKVFVIGKSFEGVPVGEGSLFLQIVPSPWNNPCSGVYTVRIRTDYVSLSQR